MEIPIKMDDLGVPLFLKTPKCSLVLFVLKVFWNHHCLPKGFNHPNWVNHYFNGGGSLGNVHFFCSKGFLEPLLVRKDDIRI